MNDGSVVCQAIIDIQHHSVNTYFDKTKDTIFLNYLIHFFFLTYLQFDLNKS